MNWKKVISHGVEQSLQIENNNYKGCKLFILLTHFINICGVPIMSKTLGMDQSLDSQKYGPSVKLLPNMCQGTTDEKYLRTSHSQLFEDDRTLSFYFPSVSCLQEMELLTTGRNERNDYRI